MKQTPRFLMEKLKITQLLKSLSPDEFKKLGKFISSPCNNESLLMINLYKLFKKEYPSFDKPDFTREKIYLKLYPKEKYDYHKLRDRFSDFVKLTERFIVFNSIAEDNYGFHLRLLDYLKKKNLDDIFEKELSEQLKDLNDEFLKDEIFYKKQFELKEMHWDYILSHHIPGSTEILDHKVSEVDDLINFFLIKLLKSYLNIINGQSNINYDHRFTFFEYIMNYLDDEIETHKDIKLIYILYNFYKLYKVESNDNTYFELKNFVKENEKFIDKKYIGVLYVELINYCQSRKEKGGSEFGKEGLNLVKHMLELGLLFESDGTIYTQNYSAIVSSALRIKEIKWAEEFIRDYTKFLLPKDRDDTYLYNMSILFYVKSEQMPEKKNELLNKSLDCLSKVKCEDFIDKTAVNNHLLVIYYDLNHIDQMISLIDTYRHYLASNTLIPEEQKTRYHNFINFIARIIKLREGSQKVNITNLREEIQSAPVCENRKWLLTKIDEILK